MEVNELSKNAMGGTELMMNRLYNSGLDLSDFQIIPSRVRDLQEDKIKIYYCHDLADDPETNHLANGGWSKFNHIVFVSNQQMQQYIRKYNIPWSHCSVIENAIEPFQKHCVEKENYNPIRLAYTSTPHRGLDILLYVLDDIIKNTENQIYLDVFSSFKLYGWPERDEQFRNLFAFCENHPNITYHGTQPNHIIRKHLAEINHIWCLPSTWEETSCLSLIEALCSDNICVHSNLGALYETAGEKTIMYPYHENPYTHALLFKEALLNAINIISSNKHQPYFYWNIPKYMLKTYIDKWDTLLKNLKANSNK